MINIFDCGARGGKHRSWQKFGLPFKYFAFEPEPEEVDRLTQSPEDDMEIVPFALGRADEARMLHVYEQADLSSFFRFDGTQTYRYDDTIEPISEIELKCVSLDSYAEQTGHKPDFLSIDAQGASLEILLGAEKHCLSDLMGLRCEVEFIPLYKGASMFEDILKFLRSSGFTLLRLESCGPGAWGGSTDMNKWSRHQFDALPVWGDAIFVNSSAISRILSQETVNSISVEKLAYTILFCIHNSAGFYGMEILDQLYHAVPDWTKRLPSELNEQLANQVRAYLDITPIRRADVPGETGYGIHAEWIEQSPSKLDASVQQKISALYAL